MGGIGGWYEGNGAGDGRERSICTKETERRMGGIGAFVRRKWGEGWEGAERLYEGNGVEDGRERSVCLVRSEKTL